MNKKVLGIAGIAAVAVIGGTFAYFNQTSNVDNTFTVGKYGNEVIEDFTPEKGEDWQPGSKVNKVVKLVNTGDQDLVARVKFTETWVSKTEIDKDGNPVVIKTLDSVVDGWDKMIEYTAGDNKNQENIADGKVPANNKVEKTVVRKEINLKNGDWIKGDDGYFYLKKVLTGGNSTGALLESVTLAEDLDIGSFKYTKYVTSDESENTDTMWVQVGNPVDEKEDIPETPMFVNGNENTPVKHVKVAVEYEKDENGKTLIGYSDSTYTLTITTTTVQASQKAVNSVFGTTFKQPVDVEWTLAE